MALFRRNGPVVFEPHGYRKRRSWRVPRWLVWLTVGIVAGVGGLLYVQQEYLPTRLSPEESDRLQARVSELESERERLQSALDSTAGQLRASEAQAAKLGGELAAARERVQKQQQDLALFEEVMPPDPRGGAIAVRAARFANEDGRLAYHVLLTRDAKGSRAFRGVMQLVVAGERASGRNESVSLDPVEVNLTSYAHLQGALPLPEGFTARQATIRVLDGPDGRVHGMRVIHVR